ncbi:hypothetical protein [Flavobacterium sp. YO64]|uniref:hypothetical protein n=1 Tax=Flavobacterium sp. YO64 TaxID=394559 RepID=UPI00100A61A3|nr:hypothetical protein [Flavobacterium sp. YO64]RXM44191.1 hypothetical protein BOW57_09890 [Flavobacterium sp. YO64]
MKRAKTYTIVDNYFKLDMRLKKLEDLITSKELVTMQGDGSSSLIPLKKCRSSYSKIELANLFYVLMDEGILYFDSNDAKKNRGDFQKFISKNFTYNDNEGGQKTISTISRQFSECKGYTYKIKQIKFLDDFIAVMQERRRRLEKR